MSFQGAKDELLKWLVPALLAGIFYSINDLSKEMVVLRTTQSFVIYRIDQQRDSIMRHTEDIGNLKAQAKVFETYTKGR